MLDVSTVLLQWSVGGMVFLWVTTRRREVGLGYGWLQRGVFGMMALGAALLAEPTVVAVASWIAFVSIVAVNSNAIRRRAAGVMGQRQQTQRRSARVAQMTGIDRDEVTFDEHAREFAPRLDLVVSIIGMGALLLATSSQDSYSFVVALRVLVGALFLGALTDAMLLGHWYLVQPGLARDALRELVTWVLRLTPIEIGVFLLPTGMVSAVQGTVNDGYSGLLSWFWVLCGITTLGLGFVTRAALKEKEYSAVMAATGLLYLAILTGFGTDLVARAILY